MCVHMYLCAWILVSRGNAEKLSLKSIRCSFTSLIHLCVRLLIYQQIKARDKRRACLICCAWGDEQFSCWIYLGTSHGRRVRRISLSRSLLIRVKLPQNNFKYLVCGLRSKHHCDFVALERLKDLINQYHLPPYSLPVLLILIFKKSHRNHNMQPAVSRDKTTWLPSMQPQIQARHILTLTM